MGVTQNDRFKLVPPACRITQIERQHLLAQSALIINYKLILVCAAAGFGKTNLLGQWHQEMLESDVVAGWLTLDKSDSDRLIFIASLANMLGNVCPGCGDYTQQLLESQSEPNLDEVMDRLCSDFSKVQFPAVFFIDEYDWADAPGTNQVMERLLRDTAENIVFVVAGRSQPRLPLPRMRLHNVSRIITAEELCFTLHETEEFLNRVHSLGLSESDVELIFQKTEGWVAGLQLVMLALRDSHVSAEKVRNLSGETRDIADYLAADVLEQQPVWLREFLMKTSVLGRINAELAELMTGRHDAQTLLERLEQANLFLAPVGEGRRWYRFHPLFREFLLSCARRDPKIDELMLLAVASNWFEAHDMADEAVQCALEAGQKDRAAALVESNAEKMIVRGQIRQVIGWITRIPPRVAEKRLRLSLVQVWVLFHLGRAQQGRAILAHIREHVADENSYLLGNYSEDRLREELHTLEMCLTAVIEDGQSYRHLEKKVDKFSTEYPFLSGTRANALAACSYSSGSLAKCTEYAREGLKLTAMAGSSYGKVFALCLQGLVALSHGSLSEAAEYFYHGEQAASEDTGTSSYCFALAQCLSGVVHYLHFELDVARNLLSKNISLIAGCGYVEIWRLASTIRARIYAWDNQWTQAEDILRRTMLEYQMESPRYSLPVVLDERVRLALRANDLDAAFSQAMKHGLSLTRPGNIPDCWQRDQCLYLTTQARLFLANGEAVLALRCARELKRLAANQKRQLAWIEYALLEAEALQAMHKTREAQEAMYAALEVAAVENIVAPFLEEGQAAARLLACVSATASRGYVHRPFLEKLQRIFDEIGAAPSTRAVSEEPPSQLTAREVDVLRMVAEGAENREISERLKISENTVKWHMRNTLEKLGVKNRVKAALLARELGYI